MNFYFPYTAIYVEGFHQSTTTVDWVIFLLTKFCDFGVKLLIHAV